MHTRWKFETPSLEDDDWNEVSARGLFRYDFIHRRLPTIKVNGLVIAPLNDSTTLMLSSMVDRAGQTRGGMQGSGRQGLRYIH